jgi:hypothetical protein
VALVGYMNRDMVERRGWVAEDACRLSLALSEMMLVLSPGGRQSPLEISPEA